MLDHIRFADAKTLSLDEVIGHIVEIHESLERDWGDGGWAPADAAKLLKASRLDWLTSLAHSLKIWNGMVPTKESHDGMLILAWANLGSLVEGAMKFFLSVFLEDYRRSVSSKKADSIFKALWDSASQQAKDVDGLMFEKLRVFFEQEVWEHLPRDKWSAWLRHVQERRNTIHAYKSRDLGTFTEFLQDLRLYREFLLEEMTGVPDPPDLPDRE